MAGGPRKIDEYNKSLTPEQRKKNARRAATAPRKNAGRIVDIRKIARMINEAPAGKDLTDALLKANIQTEGMTNAAGIALAVYQAAIDGDMKAVEKWESYVGQTEKSVWPVDTVEDDELSKSLKEMAKELKSDEA